MPSDRPADARSVPLAHTLDFIGFYLPPEARLLEIGAGRGELAAELKRRGHRVLALDASEEAVQAARSLGVTAEVVTFPNYLTKERFDAILFTRSLHHIAPLALTVERAKALLAPRGVLLVEDFAWERADAATCRWRFGFETLLSPPAEMAAFPADDTLLDEWQGRYRGAVHTGDELVAAVRREFPRTEVGSAPYLYRSSIAALEGRPDGAAAAAALLRWEDRLVETGDLRPIGLRLMATR